MEDDKPSKILQAGRATGVEGASDLGKERTVVDEIASHYGPSVSGKNGDRAQFDALREIINAEISAKFNALTFSSADGSSLVGFDGKYILDTGQSTKKTGRAIAAKKETLVPWDLIPHEDETWTVYSPRVTWKREDVEDEIVITNVPFTPVAGRYLVAKIVSLATPAIQILCLSSWPGFPSAYEVGAGPTYSFVGAHLPLYKFHATFEEGRTRIANEIFAERLIGPYPSLEYRLIEAASNVLSMGIDLR